MVRKNKEMDKIEKFVNDIKKKPDNKIKPLEFKGYEIETVRHKINWIGIFRKINKFGQSLVIIKISKNNIKTWWYNYCLESENFQNKCKNFWKEYCIEWENFEKKIKELIYGKN